MAADAFRLAVGGSFVPWRVRRSDAGYAEVMTDPDGPKKRISPTRIAIWVLVSAVGIYMVVSGVLGAIANGS